jgi:predicted enzyme related to lactoylglutathione lyase
VQALAADREVTMALRTKHASGIPSWTDLQTTDPNAAKTFYASLFGWDYDDQDTGDPSFPYTIATKKGKAAAGLSSLPEEQQGQGIPPHWNTYVTVDNVDASAGAAAKAGGAVLMPGMDVMDAGRMAVVADPSGAVLCLWTPKASIGAELVNEPGALCWNELITPDPEAVASFYADLFGWNAQTADMGGGMEYTLYRLGDRDIAGGMKPPMEGIPPVWTVYFAVEDADATVAEATKNGASVIAPPVDIPPGRMAVLADPQGAMFSVLALTQPLD